MGRGQQTIIADIGSLREETITLYHGTSSIHWPQISSQGLPARSYLTDDLSLAEYYAGVAAEDGEEIVLEVQAPKTSLVTDVPALEEPIFVTYAANNNGKDRQETLWEEADRACLEAAVENWQDLPWAISLELTNSVLCCSKISPSDIKLYYQ